MKFALILMAACLLAACNSAPGLVPKSASSLTWEEGRDKAQGLKPGMRKSDVLGLFNCSPNDVRGGTYGINENPALLWVYTWPRQEVPEGSPTTLNIIFSRRSDSGLTDESAWYVSTWTWTAAPP
jgi:hypothetical protein